MVGPVRLEGLHDKEIGYLTGLFIGDGYANYNKNDRHYRVDFYLDTKKDQEIIRCVRDLIGKTGLSTYIVKCRGSTRVSCNSKKFMEFIARQEEDTLRGEIKNNDYALGVISGFIDADGYVNNGDIVLVQKDKRVLDRLKQVSEGRFKVKTRMWRRITRFKGIFPIWNLRLSMDFRHLPHNSCKVCRYSGKLLQP